MLDRIIDALAKIADNTWAFLLFLLAAVLALVALLAWIFIVYKFHGSDASLCKDLLQFAGTIAMTAAALFHGKDKKD